MTIRDARSPPRSALALATLILALGLRRTGRRDDPPRARSTAPARRYRLRWGRDGRRRHRRSSCTSSGSEASPHVFVSRFVGGTLAAPGPSRHRTALRRPAGHGSAPPTTASSSSCGRRPYATEHEEPVDELLGPTLGPGSSTFGPAILIDPNIQDGAGTSPDLAVELVGTGRRGLPRRSIAAQHRSPASAPRRRRRAGAHGPLRRTSAGRTSARSTASPGISMRPPTEANAPKIAIGATGNGVVVWQEPEIEGVARIWARRLFGSSLDYVLPVSISSFNGRDPIVHRCRRAQRRDLRSGPGDRRLPPGGRARDRRCPVPRIFLNTLPDGEAQGGARVPRRDPRRHRPAAARHERRAAQHRHRRNAASRDFCTTPTAPRASSRATTRGPHHVRSRSARDFAGSEQSSASVMNPEGGGVSAWPSADARGPPGRGGARGLPQRRGADRLGQRRRGRRSR